MRINRFFTDQGIMSRRAADAAIVEGRVRINGRVAKLGDQIEARDKVTLDGKLMGTVPKRPVIIAFNKPVGIECTTDSRVPENIVDAVNYSERIFNIGRLDKDSEGLILLTNRGEIVNDILRSHNNHEKEYIVELSGAIADGDIDELRKGVPLDDGRTKPCRVFRMAARKVKIVLTEGRNRQIRRMIEHIGLEVVRLKRVRIMNILLDHLPVGQWRKLSGSEEKALLGQLAGEKPSGSDRLPKRNPTKMPRRQRNRSAKGH